MADQLELAPAVRTYTCCGEPCPPLVFSNGPQPDAAQYPHAEDCPNPNVGTWIDRFNRPLRRLWCSDTARMGGPCPYGGERRDGKPCCKELERA